MPIYLIITFVHRVLPEPPNQSPSLIRKFHDEVEIDFTATSKSSCRIFNERGKQSSKRCSRCELEKARRDFPFTVVRRALRSIACLDLRRRDFCVKMDRECWDTCTITEDKDDEVLAAASRARSSTRLTLRARDGSHGCALAFPTRPRELVSRQRRGADSFAARARPIDCHVRFATGTRRLSF